MDNMQIILIICSIGIIEALHCDKEFNYYDNYGHGFDITCQGITEQHLHILSNITINNEISLTIGNSSLTNITSNLFKNIQHLRCFYLENSTFIFSEDEQVFHLLHNLEHLVVKNTPFVINKNTLVGLESLSNLELSNNNLSKIEQNSFKNLGRLRNLKITNNLIKDFTYLPLCEVRDLRMLNLSSNLIEDLDDQVFYCRSSSKEMDIDLNDKKFAVNVQSNDFSSIRDFALELTHVDLNNNKIKEIGMALSDLKFLRILRLEKNLIKHIDNNDFQSLYYLEELYMSNNYLEKIGEKVFENKASLDTLDFSFNKLKSFTISSVPLLKKLNLGYNEITSLKFIVSATLKSLQNLILCNNKIETIDPYTFQQSPDLEILDLGNNKVVLENESFNGLHKLGILILRNNSLQTLPVNMFNDLSELRTLDLSHNKLRLFEYSTTFQPLKELKVLNISYNLLEDINYDLLQPLDNLHVLDIAGNRLKTIQYDLILVNLPLLSVLNIKSNLLSCNFLSKIVKFLNEKKVSYTSVDKFDFDKENVAGIYCVNDEMSQHASVSEMPIQRNVLVSLSISVLTIIAVISVGIGLYKFHIYLKRRKYRADEFELIHE